MRIEAFLLSISRTTEVV